MTPSELLTHLQACGATCRVEGGTLHVSPRALLTPALREAIRTYKAALLGLLIAPGIDDDPGPWRYQSHILGVDIWLCMTEADVAALRAEGAIGYTPGEIRVLQAMQGRDPENFPAKLRALHQMKDIFGVAIEGAEHVTTPSA